MWPNKNGCRPLLGLSIAFRRSTRLTRKLSPVKSFSLTISPALEEQETSIQSAGT